jgi:hypothetical protein
MDRRLFLATAAGFGASVLPAIAQTPPAATSPAPPAATPPAPPAATPPAPPTRVRGTIASLEGNVLTVNSRDGSKVEITLNDPFTVATVKKVELSSIKETDFIGTATRTGADGKMTAIEVLVFPEAARGTGEGFYPWDLEPGSMMTNGTVKGAVTAASGRELTVAYKDKSNTVTVPPSTPVVTFAPGARDDLKAGMHVFCIATKNPEGKLTAARVTVEKDGVAPPM